LALSTASYNVATPNSTQAVADREKKEKAAYKKFFS